MCQLFRRCVFFQLMLDILLYLFCIFALGIHIVIPFVNNMFSNQFHHTDEQFPTPRFTRRHIVRIFPRRRPERKL